MYWVNGKTDSDKFTLMNYVWPDLRTKKYLTEWASRKPFLMLAFFFGAPRSTLQKSIERFLRSIIYQILAVRRELISLVQQDGRLQAASMHAWTEKGLLSKLKILAREVTKSCCVCLFIDRLEEFDGDYFQLVGLSNKLLKMSISNAAFLAGLVDFLAMNLAWSHR